MILLDLIGAPDAKFYNYFQDTEHWYARLTNSEKKLGMAGHLSQLWQRPNTYFQPYSTGKTYSFILIFLFQSLQ